MIIITLEIGGKQLVSEELADKIEQLGIQESRELFLSSGSDWAWKRGIKKI